jgi:hypothetical protein
MIRKKEGKKERLESFKPLAIICLQRIGNLLPIVESILFIIELVVVIHQGDQFDELAGGETCHDSEGKKGKERKVKKGSEVLGRFIPRHAVTFHGLPIECTRLFSRQNGRRSKRP